MLVILCHNESKTISAISSLKLLSPRLFVTNPESIHVAMLNKPQPQESPTQSDASIHKLAMAVEIF
jgi:hypothetical protein